MSKDEYTFRVWHEYERDQLTIYDVFWNGQILGFRVAHKVRQPIRDIDGNVIVPAIDYWYPRFRGTEHGTIADTAEKAVENGLREFRP